MKFFRFLCALAFSVSAMAEAPKWGKDVSQVLAEASKDKKLAFILMGRESCSNCQAIKAMVNGGTVPVTAETFVSADINIDDARSQAEFERKFKKEKFGEVLPFVVIADSKGKALASFSGFKDRESLAALIEEAKKKVK